MCSIAGFYNSKDDFMTCRTYYEKILDDMQKKLYHRGPDEHNSVLQNHCGLSHTRLSIIDLTGGQQPMRQDLDGYSYHIVYNGINPDRFSGMAPFESHLHRPIETFGFVGRITEHKGLYVLLDAMKHIHGQNPKSTLIICGDGTDKQIKHMLSYIRKSGMDGYVQYVGFKSDMVPVYEQMDCLVLPTITREAFGLVICEAMYCGVPVISSGSGAQREMIEHGESGYIVDPLDVDTLIHCMNYVMKHTEYQSRIIIKARHTVETKFTISRVVDELLSIIDDIH